MYGECRKNLIIIKKTQIFVIKHKIAIPYEFLNENIENNPPETTKMYQRLR